MSDVKILTPEQVQKVKEDFMFFDRDSNGRIDVDEFFELLQVLSPNAKQSQAEEGFALIDQNHDGAVDFDEFLAWWNNSWWEY